MCYSYVLLQRPLNNSKVVGHLQSTPNGPNYRRLCHTRRGPLPLLPFPAFTIPLSVREKYSAMSKRNSFRNEYFGTFNAFHLLERNQKELRSHKTMSVRMTKPKRSYLILRKVISTVNGCK